MAEDLEELDRLLGFECSSPFPGGTIDPRRLVNDDEVQINLGEGSRIRREDSGAVHERDKDVDLNLKARDPTDLNARGAEEKDPRVHRRTRIRLRLSREDNKIVEGEDESILESSEDRDDQEEEGDQQAPQRDILGTSLNPSESRHTRNSFPPRRKRKYTRRYELETQSPLKRPVATARTAEVASSETPPAPRQKRKYTRRQPTVSTLPEQNSSGSQLQLQEVPSSSRPKRKYTPRQSKVQFLPK